MTTKHLKFCPIYQGTSVDYTTGNISTSVVVCPTCQGNRCVVSNDEDNLSTDSDNINIKLYAQYVKIKRDDYHKMMDVLMNAGYECLVRYDDDNDLVIIKYLNPEYTGHYFQEAEF